VEGRLPVPGSDELGTIKKLSSGQEGPGKIGAVEHRFEQVHAFQVSGRQVRPVQVRPAEIGAAKIHSRKVEATQIEPSQTGPRQVRRLVVFRPPCVPCCGATAEHRDVLIVWHLLPLSSLRGGSFRGWSARSS
jgi:hypothetical protein